jgi:hypothetical protein
MVTKIINTPESFDVPAISYLYPLSTSFGTSENKIQINKININNIK